MAINTTIPVPPPLPSHCSELPPAAQAETLAACSHLFWPGSGASPTRRLFVVAIIPFVAQCLAALAFDDSAFYRSGTWLALFDIQAGRRPIVLLAGILPALLFIETVRAWMAANDVDLLRHENVLLDLSTHGISPTALMNAIMTPWRVARCRVISAYFAALALACIPMLPPTHDDRGFFLACLAAIIAVQRLSSPAASLHSLLRITRVGNDDIARALAGPLIFPPIRSAVVHHVALLLMLPAILVGFGLSVGLAFLCFISEALLDVMPAILLIYGVVAILVTGLLGRCIRNARATAALYAHGSLDALIVSAIES